MSTTTLLPLILGGEREPGPHKGDQKVLPSPSLHFSSKADVVTPLEGVKLPTTAISPELVVAHRLYEPA